MSTAVTKNGKIIKNYFSDSIFTSGPKDKEVDKLIEKSYEGLYDKALAKASINASDCIRPSVIITGPKLNNLGGAEFSIKKGKDNYIRYIPLGITIINFLPHQLVAYQCVFDPTTENALNESTLEYFYKDVVALETKTISRTEKTYTFSEKVINKIPVIKKLFDTGKVEQYNDAEIFVLTTSGGTKLEVVLTERVLIEAVGGGELPKTLSENSVKVVRKMLREKKMSY
ncbi:MAG: hypothetical protein MRZ79_22515 [Bacteroidia bacterium]|nr:hypothetical protein [Bacteroidia bacterium]